MSHECWRVVLVIATLVGFGLTVGGLIAAFVSAFKEVEASRVRISKSLRLAKEEEQAGKKARELDPTTDLSEKNHEFMRRYRAEKLIRPSMANVAYLPAFEARRLVKLTLQDARMNLIVAGVGLTVSTAGAVIGLIVL